MDILQAVDLHKAAIRAIIKGLAPEMTDDQIFFSQTEKRLGGKKQTTIYVELSLSPDQREELSAIHDFRSTTFGIITDYLTAARERFNVSAEREYLWIVLKINGGIVTSYGRSPYSEWLQTLGQPTDAVSQIRQGISLEEMDRFPDIS